MFDILNRRWLRVLITSFWFIFDLNDYTKNWLSVWTLLLPSRGEDCTVSAWCDFKCIWTVVSYCWHWSVSELILWADFGWVMFGSWRSSDDSMITFFSLFNRLNQDWSLRIWVTDGIRMDNWPKLLPCSGKLGIFFIRLIVIVPHYFFVVFSFVQKEVRLFCFV